MTVKKHLIKCDNCSKKVRSSNVQTLISGSPTGSIFVTHLCGKCGNNKTILKKVMNINDRKLERMDGISLGLDT